MKTEEQPSQAGLHNRFICPRVQRFKYRIPKRVANMTVCRVCEGHCVDDFDSFASAEDEGAP